MTHRMSCSSGIRGVAIYYKDSRTVNEVEFPGMECQDHAWVEIVTERNESLLCGCIYRTQFNDADKKTKGL